jgi:bifunctional NMN adenylyltransferase/nudix hydrolase
MESFTLYGSRDSFIPWYNGHLPVAALPELGEHSASAIRNENSDKVLDSVDFRLGVNYAYHSVYPKVYPTVDIAVLKQNNTLVLMGKKHYATQWRFPGGFSDPEDETYECAARRELAEECGDIETGIMQYIGSAKINDWRYKHEVDKIITSLFKTALVFGTPKANDDLAELDWIEIKELPGMMEKNIISKEHFILVNMLLNNLGTQLPVAKQ